MNYLIGYLLASYAMLFLFAWRTREQAIRAALLVTLLWPVSILIVGLSLAVATVGWQSDVDETPEHLSTFGFRKPNDGWPGFAVRGFGIEIMFWKRRK